MPRIIDKPSLTNLRLQLGRLSGGDESTPFRLSIEDIPSGRMVLDVRLSVEGFADLLTSRSADGAAEVWSTALVGRRLQVSSQWVKLCADENPYGRTRQLPDRVLRAAEAQAEAVDHVDGIPWCAESAEYNGHKMRAGNEHSVNLLRWLPKDGD